MGMLKKLDHSVCHQCWDDLLASIKESPTILALRQLIAKKIDKIKTENKNTPEFLTISNEDHWSEMLEMLEELDDALEGRQKQGQS